MSVIAEFTIEAGEFLLGQVLARHSSTQVDMERVVPASGRVMPYVWVQGGDLKEFETAIENSENVRSLTPLDILDDSGLYRIEWDEQVESLVYGVAETNATILEARGNEEWQFRIRFDDHSGLTEFNNFCSNHGIQFQLNRVYTFSEKREDDLSFGLTDAQREALVAAVEGGYFEVPRQTTLGEIGKELEITEQSVSENLRRGVDQVLKRLLLERTAEEFQ